MTELGVLVVLEEEAYLLSLETAVGIFRTLIGVRQCGGYVRCLPLPHPYPGEWLQ